MTELENNIVFININLIISLCNDCVSYAKEVGKVAIESAVRIIMEERNCDVYTAIEEIHRMCGQLFDEIKDLPVRDSVKNVLDGLNLWTFGSGRYRYPASQYIELLDVVAVAVTISQSNELPVDQH